MVAFYLPKVDCSEGINSLCSACPNTAISIDSFPVSLFTNKIDIVLRGTNGRSLTTAFGRSRTVHAAYPNAISAGIGICLVDENDDSTAIPIVAVR